MGTTIYFAPWELRSEGTAFAPDPTPITTGSSPLGSLTDNKSALVKTPPGKWRKPTTYSRTIIKGFVERPLCKWRVDYNPSGRPQVRRYATYTGPSGSPPSGYSLTPPTFPSELSLRTEQRAFRKLKQQNVNLAVAFGERAATAEHLALTAGRILGGLKAARRLDVRYMAKQLRMNPQILENRCRKILRRKFNTVDGKAHSLWLEAQYGWKPLLSDVHGMVTELIEKDNRFEDRYRVHCTAKDDWLEQTYRSGTIAASGTFQCEYGMTTRTRFRTYCRFDWVLNNPMLASASELGITNPLETAWELVPFSFVADWFIPLGTYLSSLDVGTGWSFKGGSMSKLTRSSRRFHMIGQPRLQTVNALNQVGFNYSPVSTQTLTRLTRSTYVTAPQPWMPSIFGDGLGPGNRMANAIALLGSFFRK